MRELASHLSEDEIGQLLTSRLARAGHDSAARHLLSGCGVCGRALLGQASSRQLQRASEIGGGTAALPTVRDRALAVALRQEARERTEQEKLTRSLDLLRESPRSYDGPPFRVGALHGRRLVETLLQRSFELRFRDSQTMRWLAYNALKAAESLRPEEHSQLVRSDLQARAWAELANAYRINDELAEAAAAFERARVLLRQGSGDLGLLARLASLEASFLVDRRRLTEAGELLDKIHRLHQRLGDPHLIGRTLISQGIGSRLRGEHRRSLERLREGLSLLDPDRDPDLLPVAQQNIIASLVSCGDYRQAAELFLKSGLRQSFSADPFNLLRMRWIEGTLMAGLDKLPRAGAVLRGVRADLLDLDQRYDAALVDHDLLPILLRQGRPGETRSLARESYETFRSLGIHQDATRLQRYLY